jgi:hypothetical protein
MVTDDSWPPFDGSRLLYRCALAVDRTRVAPNKFTR